MKVSIIVPAFNEEKLIQATLRSISDAAAAFAERGWETELIVCDNNSSDATGELARAEEGARVVFEPLNQIGRARNTGAAAATGEWLIFVDADSRPRRELFGEVAQEMATERCLGGGCTVRLDEWHFVMASLTGLWNLVSRINKWAAGSFVFCQTEAFRKVGGFNLELFASEEIDLSKRLKKAARAAGKKMVILHRYPLLTSARKVRLYSTVELLGFSRRAIFSPRRTITSREACGPWYDGRR